LIASSPPSPPTLARGGEEGGHAGHPGRRRAERAAHRLGQGLRRHLPVLDPGGAGARRQLALYRRLARRASDSIHPIQLPINCV
jgi:hypothetical protein